jgi:hypothetical protein
MSAFLMKHDWLTSSLQEQQEQQQEQQEQQEQQLELLLSFRRRSKQWPEVQQ